MITSHLDLNIAAEFTTFPGPRKRTEGEYSGEQFLDELLRPKFLAAREAQTTLSVNLDGAAGYPTSFLEEAFGGLAREFGSKAVLERLDLTCNDEPYLKDEIRKYIEDVNK